MASRYAVAAQASVASGAPSDRKKYPTIKKMASTVATSTQEALADDDALLIDRGHDAGDADQVTGGRGRISAARTARRRHLRAASTSLAGSTGT